MVFEIFYQGIVTAAASVPASPATPSSASMNTAPSSTVEPSTTTPSSVNNGGSASLPNGGGDSLSTSPSSFNGNGGGSNGGSNSADTNNDTGNALELPSWFWPATIGGCVVLLCVCVGCIAKSSKGVRSRLGIEESKQSLAKHKTWESFDLSNIELVENPLDKMEPESSDQGTVPV